MNYNRCKTWKLKALDWRKEKKGERKRWNKN